MTMPEHLPFLNPDEGNALKQAWAQFVGARIALDAAFGVAKAVRGRPKAALVMIDDDGLLIEEPPEAPADG